jgi:hypothetical protein
MRRRMMKSKIDRAVVHADARNRVTGEAAGGPAAGTPTFAGP